MFSINCVLLPLDYYLLMTGSLTEKQIQTLLTSEVVGRLGGCLEGRPYVVPVTYVFEAPYEPYVRRH